MAASSCLLDLALSGMGKTMQRWYGPGIVNGRFTLVVLR